MEHLCHHFHVNTLYCFSCSVDILGFGCPSDGANSVMFSNVTLFSTSLSVVHRLCLINMLPGFHCSSRAGFAMSFCLVLCFRMSLNLLYCSSSLVILSSSRVVASVIFPCTSLNGIVVMDTSSLLGFQSLFLHTGSVEFWLGLLLCQQVQTMFLPGLVGSAQLHSSSWNLMSCCSL